MHLIISSKTPHLIFGITIFFKIPPYRNLKFLDEEDKSQAKVKGTMAGNDNNVNMLIIKRQLTTYIDSKL